MNPDKFWHQLLGRPYQLHTERHGDPDKPVVILLHGIAASSEDWQLLIPLLTPRYHCITIDLLGFAKSPKPQWAAYDMDDHVRSIEATIRRLDIDGRFILVGHSLGSLLATRYARSHRRRIERLLLLSPPVYPPLDTITSKAALRRTNVLLRIYKLLRTHPRVTPENVRRLRRIIPLPQSIIADPQTWLPFFRSLEHCIEQQTIMRDITLIKQPVDVFFGNLDSVVVGGNVRPLARQSNVRLYRFRGNHAIGRVYARSVAASLGIRPAKRSLSRPAVKRRGAAGR